MSCQVVPWPGSRGRETVSPAAARSSAHGRSDAGLPVNPWQSRTPVLPPEWKKGSAPGITGMTAVLSRLRSPASSHADHDRAHAERKEPGVARATCPAGRAARQAKSIRRRGLPVIPGRGSM